MISMEPIVRSLESRPAITAASSVFRRFSPETERPVRTHRIESGTVLGAMKIAWEGSRLSKPDGKIEDQKAYGGMLERISRLGYTAKDVEGFSIALEEYQAMEDFSKKAGYFLSALVNGCEDNGFTIHTSHLAKPIEGIGYRNTKTITVDGCVGENVGLDMEGGLISVDGNADKCAGIRMRCGKIIVRGDAGNCAGYQMKGGRLVVEGNASYSLGTDMEGGTILVEGDADKNIANRMKGGKLVVRGKTDGFCGEMMTGGEVHLFGSLFIWAGGVERGKIFHRGILV